MKRFYKDRHNEREEKFFKGIQALEISQWLNIKML